MTDKDNVLPFQHLHTLTEVTLADLGEDNPIPTEIDLAIQFAERFPNDRWVEPWKCWMVCDGTRWQEDEWLNVITRAREIAKEAADKTGRRDLAHAKTVAAIEKLARADERLVGRVKQWDANPWLLNTPGGVVDLQTGNMRPHQLTDYLTQQTAVTPIKGECSLWHISSSTASLITMPS